MGIGISNHCCAEETLWLNQDVAHAESTTQIAGLEDRLPALVGKCQSFASGLGHIPSGRLKATWLGGACPGGVEPCHSGSLADASPMVESSPAPLAPTVPVSEYNGVRIEREYDHFQPGLRKRQKLQMTDADRVIHQRPKLTPAERRDRHLSNTSEDGMMMEESSSRSSESSYLSLEAEKQADGSPAYTPRSAEIVTRWGILTGKTLYYKVLALTTLSNNYISRNKLEKDDKGSLWRRVESRAKKVVSKVKGLSKKVANMPRDCLDAEWADENLLSQLFTTEYLDTLMILAKATTKLVSAQPILAETTAPCRVFGDIHGQLRDMLLLFDAFGSPTAKNAPNFVFNGDFVDRGTHQLEVIGILFALKIAYPNRIWLVRGNHEDRGMNDKYGFKTACIKHLGSEFGLKTFDLFEEAFDHLPLACLISGRILCVHGGIGNGRWDLNALRALQRPITDKFLTSRANAWVYNILWSDPIEDDGIDAGAVVGVHDSPRASAGVTFGWDVTKTFCAKNGLGLVIRSHQSKRDGLGFDVMHDEMLIRVFSARDYEGGGNDGAVVIIQEEPSVHNPQEMVLSVRPQVVTSSHKQLRIRKPAMDDC